MGQMVNWPVIEFSTRLLIRLESDQRSYFNTWACSPIYKENEGKCPLVLVFHNELHGKS